MCIQLNLGSFSQKQFYLKLFSLQKEEEKMRQQTFSNMKIYNAFSVNK